MPRNRKTRGRPTSQSHAKALVPDGDEGKDLETEIRQKKIETMISDFDYEVANYVAGMRKDVTLYLRKLQVLYSVELLKLPKHIREMRISDFLASGGVIDDTVAEDVEDHLNLAIDARVDARVDKVAKGKKAQVDQANIPASNTRMKPPRGKAPHSSLQCAGNGGRAVRRTRQKGMETPMNQGFGGRGWETPFITPKFDPRLPITPAIGRTARPGEVTMSISGSPIIQRTDPRQPEFVVPLSRNRTMWINADTELDVDIPDMDETTLNKLVSIQDKLSRLLRMHDK